MLINEQSFLNIPRRHLEICIKLRIDDYMLPKIFVLVHFYKMLDCIIVTVRSSKHAIKILDHF